MPAQYEGTIWLLDEYKGNNKYGREKVPEPKVSWLPRDYDATASGYIEGASTKNVRLAIVKLCAFLNAISQKVIDPEIIPRLQNDLVQCLVSFELVFPPSFFNIMTHVLVHLCEEINVLGPVFLHNVFPFERFMGVLKKYVHNRARPEGSDMSPTYL